MIINKYEKYRKDDHSFIDTRSSTILCETKLAQ